MDKDPNLSAKELADRTGLSLSTVYRRRREGYKPIEIYKEAAIMKKHKDAGSNWKKVAKNTGRKVEDLPEEPNTEWTGQDPSKLPEAILDITLKERKRVVHWEPADDYGMVSRLKVLGGWIVKVEKEVLFVMDPKHKWEV